MEQKYYKHVRFYPWIGTHYEDGLNGVMVLILGESHYCKEGENSQKSRHQCPPGVCAECYMDEECHNKTKDTIKELWEGKWNKSQNTQRAFEKNVRGKRLTREEEIYFWEHVAFYEYIQYSQPKPRHPLRSGNIDYNIESFLEVINILRPDRIIIWGKRFYHLLIETFGGKINIDLQNERALYWQLEYGTIVIPVLIVDHPCAPLGKKTSIWNPTIIKFF